LNRRIVAIALGTTAIAVIGACLAPIALTPPVAPCTRLSTPVSFSRVESRAVPVSRGTRPFPVVEYSYVVSGKRYTSTRIFCDSGEDVVVNWPRVERFFDDARNGAAVVAWVAPSSPESACLSLNREFGYSVVSNTSSQCRAR